MPATFAFQYIPRSAIIMGYIIDRSFDVMNEIKFEGIRSLLATEFKYVPNTGNMGDTLITHGEYLFFENYNLNYDSKSYTQVVCGGGGGLVEGYYGYSIETLLKYLKKGYQVLVLPHTIVGYYDIFNKYKDQLTIICREKKSYSGLVENGFPEDNLYICSDMALYLEELRIGERYKYPSPLKVLMGLRTDKESRDNHKLKNSVDLSKCYDSTVMSKEEVEAVAKYMLQFISLYSIIVTDRLHVGIACALLGKECYFMGNSYYKNRAVFEYSLERKYPSIKFVDSLSDIPSYVIEAAGEEIDPNLLVVNLNSVLASGRPMHIKKCFYQRVIQLLTCVVPSVELRKKMRSL